MIADPPGAHEEQCIRCTIVASTWAALGARGSLVDVLAGARIHESSRRENRRTRGPATITLRSACVAKKKPKKEAKARRGRSRGGRIDARLVAVQVAGAVEGKLDIKPGDWILAVSPVRLPDGSVVAYHPPQPVAFNLLEAKRHRDGGVKQRRAILGNLEAPDANGQRRPQDSAAVIDCLSNLVGAVLRAFTAIESLANHSIDQLDDNATVNVERQGQPVTIGKADMVRRLNITEKLELAVPQLADGNATKGTKAWERFVHLKRLRDDLVHVKDRGYSNDPDQPSAYGQLLAGAGDACVEEAAGLVAAARPTFLPDHVRIALGL